MYKPYTLNYDPVCSYINACLVLDITHSACVFLYDYVSSVTALGSAPSEKGKSMGPVVGNLYNEYPLVDRISDLCGLCYFFTSVRLGRMPSRQAAPYEVIHDLHE